MLTTKSQCSTFEFEGTIWKPHEMMSMLICHKQCTDFVECFFTKIQNHKPHKMSGQIECDKIKWIDYKYKYLSIWLKGFETGV